MSTIIGISVEELSSLITTAVGTALEEQEKKAGTHRLCNSVEARKILGGVSHSWMNQLQKSGLLRPQVGGSKRGSTRFYKYSDIIAYMNRPKRK